MGRMHLSSGARKSFRSSVLNLSPAEKPVLAAASPCDSIRHCARTPIRYDVLISYSGPGQKQMANSILRNKDTEQCHQRHESGQHATTRKADIHGNSTHLEHRKQAQCATACALCTRHKNAHSIGAE